MSALGTQWAERNSQTFAWVSVDDRDNDPKVLLAYVAQALDAVQPVGAGVFEALASPVSSVQPGDAFTEATAAANRAISGSHQVPGAGASGGVSQPAAYRQPSAGATWVRMLSMTWAL